ncbi:MAG: phosphate ABC transporter ATP-binding protein, partial [Calditrichaeota bacterium]
VLREIELTLREFQVNCIVGPSGSGKSTLIRSINRMNDEVEGYVCKGAIRVNGRNILSRSENVARLRTEVGMVFQKPCVFPKSIAENVLFGLQHLRKLSKHERLEVVEENLKAASLWREVRHRLNDPASSLSMGQQQRLCIARTLAVKPKIILLDEPTSSLDPVSTRAIESLMLELKKNYTIVFVTHNIQQARRIADYLIFLCNGQIIEQGPKERLFLHPEKEQTRKYLNEEYCDC